MKEISDRTSTAFSDAALMIRYHYLLLSKAAESAHRRSALLTFDKEIAVIAAL